jgi:uncharacterized protein (TIGR03437 family)
MSRALSNGTPAPLLAVSPSQVNAVVPSVGYLQWVPVTVQVVADGLASAPYHTARTRPVLLSRISPAEAWAPIVNAHHGINTAGNPAGAVRS